MCRTIKSNRLEIFFICHLFEFLLFFQLAFRGTEIASCYLCSSWFIAWINGYDAAILGSRNTPYIKSLMGLKTLRLRFGLLLPLARQGSSAIELEDAPHSPESSCLLSFILPLFIFMRSIKKNGWFLFYKKKSTISVLAKPEWQQEWCPHFLEGRFGFDSSFAFET